MHARRAFLVTLVGASLAWGCSDPAATPAPAPTPAHAPMQVEVVATRPHDPKAFTEGFEVAGETLLEGTGMVGTSWVSATDLGTGAEQRRADLPAPMFGEGITSTGAGIWQVTWKDHVAIERDPVTLAERRRVGYDGEGWGLCTQRTGDQRLIVMSNGTRRLTFRDPATFAPVRTVDLVGYGDVPINELECAEDGTIYANLWQTDTILRIDPDTGTALAVIDAGALRRALPSQAGIDVLNGIAQLPGTDRFLLTGKYWPTTFEVRFVP
ncbi:glutaminyl-peptide cyclotransferase [Aldersonia sp. NBC_00410]|uniref:glutaminyl-peptide cyclotransferase n=1 Tax=Aldersonia sp. NBC_00410 TaxID=2975954 RepID=UPI00225A3CD2|nr:glutaminyl-peptide cyclotransferase [Aldersonia sp. NBC_00410]MCX5045709.1 glutaminyl-peptide cyclotransferase [Aldersonia sp. NBC_00410]